MDWPGIEPVSPRWEASDWFNEPCHCQIHYIQGVQERSHKYVWKELQTTPMLTATCFGCVRHHRALCKHWNRTRRAIYVQRNIERVRESLLSWKSNEYYIFVCVCARVNVCMREGTCSLAYPACNAYAPYCDVICGPSGSTMFFVIIS